jgi:hypothetical protein
MSKLFHDHHWASDKNTYNILGRAGLMVKMQIQRDLVEMTMLCRRLQRAGIGNVAYIRLFLQNSVGSLTWQRRNDIQRTIEHHPTGQIRRTETCSLFSQMRASTSLPLGTGETLFRALFFIQPIHPSLPILYDNAL